MSFTLSAHARETVQDYFQRKRIPYTEDALVAVLEAGTDRDSVYWATIALRDIGTVKAIPALKAKLHYPMQDVKDCCLLTIAHIAGSAETEFFVEALRDKKTRKAYPMWAIAVAGDERALEAVLQYVEPRVRRLERAAMTDPSDAFVKGLEYLARCRRHNQQVDGLFHRIYAAWYQLPSKTQARLASVGISPPSG